MKKTLLFLLLAFIVVSCSGQGLKGKVPIDRNLRPVNAYLVGDTIVTQLRTEFPENYPVFDPELVGDDFVKLTDLKDTSDEDTVFIIPNKNVKFVTVFLPSDPDSTSIYIRTGDSATFYTLPKRIYSGQEWRFPIDMLSRVFVYSGERTFFGLYWER